MDTNNYNNQHECVFDTVESVWRVLEKETCWKVGFYDLTKNQTNYTLLYAEINGLNKLPITIRLGPESPDIKLFNIHWELLTTIPIVLSWIYVTEKTTLIDILYLIDLQVEADNCNFPTAGLFTRQVQWYLPIRYRLPRFPLVVVK